MDDYLSFVFLPDKQNFKLTLPEYGGGVNVFQGIGYTIFKVGSDYNHGTRACLATVLTRDEEVSHVRREGGNVYLAVR